MKQQLVLILGSFFLTSGCILWGFTLPVYASERHEPILDTQIAPGYTLGIRSGVVYTL